MFYKIILITASCIRYLIDKLTMVQVFITAKVLKLFYASCAHYCTYLKMALHIDIDHESSLFSKKVITRVNNMSLSSWFCHLKFDNIKSSKMSSL